jgi:hypothetical protein
MFIGGLAAARTDSYLLLPSGTEAAAGGEAAAERMWVAGRAGLLPSSVAVKVHFFFGE